MSKKRIENYIPKVMEILKKKFPDGKIPKEFNGYISSFGASIVQSGLKPTVALFENKDASTAQDKSCLTKIILEALGGQEKSLLEYVLAEKVLQEEIKDIAVAVKLVIRTFELQKDMDNVKC